MSNLLIKEQEFMEIEIANITTSLITVIMYLN
jgi:hypothetical protein